MANLTAVFRMVDEMSGQLNSIANSGEYVINQWEGIEQTANSALTATTISIDSTVDSLDDLERELIETINATEQWVDECGGAEEAVKILGDTTVKTAKSIDDLGGDFKSASDESEKFGEKSTDAIESLSTALTALGVAKALNTIKDTFGEMVNKAAEFESEMSNLGAITGASGTALNAIIRNLSTTTDKAAEALADLNIELYDNYGASRDMLEIMYEVENKLGDMTDELRNHYENIIFDTVAQKGWNTIVAVGVDNIRALSEELDLSTEGFGGMQMY